MAVRFARVDPASGTRGDEERAFTLNVGIGGAFVLTANPYPPGTEVAVILDLPDGRSFEVRADVRWISATQASGDRLGHDDGDEGESGMGLRFQDPGDEAAQVLGDFFETLSGTLDHDEGR